METTDKDLLEMQQQLQQLREKLEDQKIINDRMLRVSYSNNTQRLKMKARLPIIAGIAGIATLPALHNLGLSLPFIIFTGVIMATSAVVSAFISRLIPNMDTDLVTATENIIRYRKINKNWIKFGLPTLAVWLGLFFLDFRNNTDLLDGDAALYIGIGLILGVAVGLVIGLKNRSEVLSTSDSLIRQLEQLKQ